MSKTSFGITYALELRDKNGNLKDSREGHNLIMRNQIGYFSSPSIVSNYSSNGNVIANFRAGSGSTNPNTRTSGAVTFTNNWANSSSPFTVTASAGFFVSADTGRLLKLATGEEMAITTFINSQNITVAALPSAPTAAQLGTVYYDNLTGLDSTVTELNGNFGQASFVNSVTTGSSGTAQTVITQVVTSPPATTSHTITELGWFQSGSMMGRVYLSSPFSMSATDFIVCTITITYNYDTNAHFISAPGVNGDFSGTSRFYGMGTTPFSQPWVSALAMSQLVLAAQTVSLSTISNTYGPNLNTGGLYQSVNVTPSNSAGVLPSQSVWTSSASITSGSGNINTLAAEGGTGGVWFHALTAPVSKALGQTVTFSWASVITRTL